MTVDLGSEVEQGQLIAQLNRDNLDVQLQQAEAASYQAETRLNQQRAELVPNQVKAQAELNSAQAKLEDLLNPTAEDLRIAASAVAKSELSLESARTELEQLLHPTAATLVEAEAAVARSVVEFSDAQAELSRAIVIAQATTASGELASLWGIILVARETIDSNNAVIYHPSLRSGLTPSQVVQAQERVAASEQAIADLLVEITDEYTISEGIRKTFWAEAEAVADLRSAEAQLEALKNPDPYAIALLEQDISAAETDLEAARARLDLAKSPSKADLAKAEADIIIAEQTLALKQGDHARYLLEAAQSQVDEAEAKVRLVQQQISERQVSAPFDGIITRRWLLPGATASAQSPIVTLASRELVIAVRIDEASIGSLQHGPGISMTSPAFPGSRLVLRIDRIAPLGDEQAHTFLVHLVPVEAVPRLRPGMSGTVSFVTRHEDVVLVPKTGVLQQNGEAIVFVAEDGKAHRRLVNPGLVDSTSIEVLSGVQPGESVIVSGQGLLQDGDRVTIEQEGARLNRSRRGS